jgi:Tfp pilus assembly protein PilE
MMKIKQEDGFTFIEIFAIMLVMGSLAAVVVSMFL